MEMAETSVEMRRPAENLPSRKSTVTTRKQNAVCVRNAHKAYGNNAVLDGLNMTVAKGCIYGLLGASGCGKTTLLSCIVGRRNLKSGEIWVLGGKPGSRASGALGPRLGYMPQETALFGEITIRETMIYFGWIAGLTTEEVDKRMQDLIKLLQLPAANSTVKNLSGGQQRRVSLSAALLHSPELLILDEPTVGLDPMLRQSIWDHMRDITKEDKITIIITTHYIEESRQAHMIGLMRGGTFLAEQSPSSLMERYNASSLEQVFLELAVTQNSNKKRKSTVKQNVNGDEQEPEISGINTDVEKNEEEENDEFGGYTSVKYRRGAVNLSNTLYQELVQTPEAPVSRMDKIKPIHFRHMKAIVWKNALSLMRNWGFLRPFRIFSVVISLVGVLEPIAGSIIRAKIADVTCACSVMMFLIGLPVSQILLFCVSIGHNPEGLQIGVVNYELDPDKMLEPCFEDFTGCKNTRLSCKYLKYIQERTGNLISYGSREEVLNLVSKGELWAAVIFRQNFTTSLETRLKKRQYSTTEEISDSIVEVYRDGTNGQIDFLILKDFKESYFIFCEKLATICSYNKDAYQIPIMYHKPIYGDVGSDFTDFAGPGVILTIVFFLALASTVISMLTEKSEGILERSLVSGITGTELLFSHIVTQLMVMFIQNALVLLFGFQVYGLTCRGQMILIIFLTLLTGLCGMTFGFVVSCLCDKERTATYIAMGSFLPMIMMCGIIWPVEGMHVVLQYISYVLPLTKSTESLRSIMQRGLGLDYHIVSDGFISTSLWIIIYLSISLLVIKFKKA